MTSIIKSPFADLNLSEEDDKRVLTLICAQVDVVKQMRRLVLGLALVIIVGFVLNKMMQAAPRGPDMEVAMKTLMKCAAWIFTGMSLFGMAFFGMAVYQIRLQQLRRVAEALAIGADKRKVIADLTNDAMIRAMFGRYGYRLIGRFSGKGPENQNQN